MSLRLDPRVPLESQDVLKKLSPRRRKAALCYACKALAAPFLCDFETGDEYKPHCARPICRYHVTTHGEQHYCLQHAKGAR
jgi:hypothetical protein